jgi:hypothetical protein
LVVTEIVDRILFKYDFHDEVLGKIRGLHSEEK